MNRLGGTFAALAISAAALAQAGVQTGTTIIRSRGDDAMAGVLAALEQSFQRLHPEVGFQHELHGSGTGMAGIIASVSELSEMGRPATSNEVMGFEWVFRYKPLAIQVMNGRRDPHPQPGEAFGHDEHTAALLVVVPEANPASAISMPQLKTLLTCPDAASCGDGKRTWADAGLTGAWATRPVHAYLYDEETGTGAFVQQAIEGHGDRWNWAVVREFKDSPAGGASAAERMMQALAQDPDGIAIATVAAPGTKVLRVAPDDKAAAVAATAENLVAGTYPLGRGVYLYLNRAPGKPLPAAVEEFVRFVLSEPGQRIVKQQGDYLPMNPQAAAAQAAKLD